MMDSYFVAERRDDVKLMTLYSLDERVFCSGGDLQQFHQLQTYEAAREMLMRMNRVLYRIATFPAPTVALLDGVAIGGGMELATACDFRVATQRGKFAFVQIEQAITTGWGGATLLHERLTPTLALKWLCSAQRFSALEAMQDGWLAAVVEHDGQWREWLASYEKQDGATLRAYKRVSVERYEQSRLQERMLAESDRCAQLWVSEAHFAAVERFLHKGKKS